MNLFTLFQFHEMLVDIISYYDKMTYKVLFRIFFPFLKNRKKTLKISRYGSDERSLVETAPWRWKFKRWLIFVKWLKLWKEAKIRSRSNTKNQKTTGTATSTGRRSVGVNIESRTQIRLLYYLYILILTLWKCVKRAKVDSIHHRRLQNRPQKVEKRNRRKITDSKSRMIRPEIQTMKVQRRNPHGFRLISKFYQPNFIFHTRFYLLDFFRIFEPFTGRWWGWGGWRRPVYWYGIRRWGPGNNSIFF